jgi:hypothetical protein
VSARLQKVGASESREKTQREGRDLVDGRNGDTFRMGNMKRKGGGGGDSAFPPGCKFKRTCFSSRNACNFVSGREVTQ